MATLEELVIQLTAETSQLKAELKTAVEVTKSSTDKMEKAIGDFSKNSSKDTSVFQQAMATMAGFVGGNIVVGAFNKVKEVAGFFKDELIKGAESAEKEELALTKLANSLALSGNYSESAMRSMQGFIGAMEEQTGIADDVVADNLALLSSLTKLDSDGLQRAQKAALDLAAATGKDLRTATELIAKGIEGNVGAFKKYGIEVEAGVSKTENFNNVVGKLEKQFGGAAAGSMKTFQGAVLGATNMWGNFVEALSTAIVKNPVVIAMISKLTEILGHLTGEASNSSAALQKMVGERLVVLGKSLGITITVIDTFLRTVELMIRGLMVPINGVIGAFNYMQDALGLIKNEDPFAELKDGLVELDGVFEQQTGLQTMAETLFQLADTGEAAMGKIGASGDVVKKTIEGVKGPLQEISELEKARIENWSKFAQAALDATGAVDSAFKSQGALMTAELEAEKISVQDYYAWLIEAQAAQFELENQAIIDKFTVQGQLTADGQAVLEQLGQQHAATMIDLETKRTKAMQDEQQKRLGNYSSFFGNLASLSQSGNSQLGGIAKAAAIAQATIDMYAGANKALAQGGVFGPALAASVVAAGLANIAKINATGLAGGINSVPMSASGGNSGDNFPAILQPGERVVPKKTNQDLQEFLDGGGQSKSVTLNINISNNLPASAEAGMAMIDHINEAISKGALPILGAV